MVFAAQFGNLGATVRPPTFCHALVAYGFDWVLDIVCFVVS